LARNLGYVPDDISEAELADILPREDPPLALYEDVMHELEVSAASKVHQRAAIWAAALESVIPERQLKSSDRDVMLTTYGPVRMKDGLRFAVIRYLRPRAAFRRRRTLEYVSLAGNEFPIVERPWLPVPQNTGGQAGSCWVVPSRGSAAGRPVLLTVMHAVAPERALPGAEVSINASRGDPPGVLITDDPVMDAALIEVAPPDWWEEMEPTNISNQLGSKPVLMVTGHRNVRMQVIEQTSPRATIFAAPDQPVVIPALCTLSRTLDAGDSGCLGLDLELAGWADAAPPYLMHRGKIGMGVGGEAGLALVLEQPRRVWGLEFYVVRSMAAEVAAEVSPKEGHA